MGNASAVRITISPICDARHTQNRCTSHGGEYQARVSRVRVASLVPINRGMIGRASSHRSQLPAAVCTQVNVSCSTPSSSKAYRLRVGEGPRQGPAQQGCRQTCETVSPRRAQAFTQGDNGTTEKDLGKCDTRMRPDAGSDAIDSNNHRHLYEGFNASTSASTSTSTKSCQMAAHTAGRSI